jgi:hypothetical protein
MVGCDAAISSVGTGPRAVWTGGIGRTAGSTPAKLKQLIAQAAIDAQSPVPLSPEFACPAQSSIGWEADISIAGAGDTLKAAAAAAGSNAIKTANMVRPAAIVCFWQHTIQQ